MYNQKLNMFVPVIVMINILDGFQQGASCSSHDKDEYARQATPLQVLKLWPPVQKCWPEVPEPKQMFNDKYLFLD